MGLKGRSVIKLNDPMQRSIITRRKQYRAILNWVKDVVQGRGRRSLKDYCDELGVKYRGVYKLLREERVQKMIEDQTLAMSTYGIKVAATRMIERIESDEDLSILDMTRVGEFLSKLKYGGFGKTEVDIKAGIAVEVNLPGHVVEEAKRVEAREVAKDEFGELVE